MAMTKSWVLASLIILLSPLQAMAAKPAGMYLTLAVELEKAARPQTALQETAEILTRRLADAGVRGAKVNPYPDGSGQLLVVIPGAEDARRSYRLIETRGFLEFRLVRFPSLGGGMDSEEILFHFKGQLPADLEILEEWTGTGTGKAARKVSYAVERRPLITGADIESARPTRGQFNDPIVAFRLTEDAARVFGKATEASIGSPLAIVLDGKVLSAPVIRARIGAEGVIEGKFTEAEARELAMVLRSGPLPAPVDVILAHREDPLAGRIRIMRFLLAGFVFVFLLLVATLVWLYRRSDPARRRIG